MNIVSGEKIQNLCDICIYNDEQSKINFKEFNKNNNFLLLKDLNNPFNNPYIIFCYSNLIIDLSKKINLFLNKFILVLHNSDDCVDDRIEILNILNYKNLEKCYAQNIIFEHKKLFFLPIGISNNYNHHGWVFNNFFASNNYLENNKIIKNLHLKSKKIFFWFQIDTNVKKRQICYEILNNKLEWLNYMDPYTHFLTLKNYEF